MAQFSKDQYFGVTLHGKIEMGANSTYSYLAWLVWFGRVPIMIKM